MVLLSLNNRRPLMLYAANALDSSSDAASGAFSPSAAERLMESLSTAFVDAARPSDADPKTAILANDPVRRVKVFLDGH